MKKYFMKKSGEELQFGDMIELDFTKEMDNHTIHKRLECKFIPSLIPQLLEEGIIIEKELIVEPADEDDDDCNDDDYLEAIYVLTEKIELLTDLFKSLTTALKENTKAHAKTAGK